MDCKELFGNLGTAAREIRQQLKKEHAVRAKTAQKPTAKKFKMDDPLWVLRRRPMGTHGTET